MHDAKYGVLNNGVVLLTRCGCRRYEDWPGMSMRNDITVPLVTSFTRVNYWGKTDITMELPIETRRFERTGQSELVDNKFYTIFQEV